MRQWATSSEKRLQFGLLLGDVLAFVASTAIVVALGIGGRHDGSAQRVLPVFLLLGVYLTVYYVSDLYSVQRRHSATRQPALTSTSTALVLIIAILVGTVFPSVQALPLRGLLPHAALMLLAASAWRRVFFRRLLPAYPARSIGLLGDLSAECEILQEVAESAPNLTIDPADTETPDLWVCPVQRQVDEDTLARAVSLRLAGETVLDLPNLCAARLGRIPVSTIDASWIIQNVGQHRSMTGERLRRLLDVAGSLLAIVITSPFLAVAAAMVKLTSRGPVLFVQERLGRFEQPFPCYKIRTMVQDAEAQTGPRWAEANDPRITPVGRFLRKSRLDELPQLFNVLRGEMGLVGFRPIRRHFADKLAPQIPFYHARFGIKPGLTGWPQVRHRNSYAGSIDDQVEKFEYELFYLAHRSLLVDAYIAIKTVQVMFCVRGQ